MDIRKFFGQGPAVEKKKESIILSDDEENPLPKKLKMKKTSHNTVSSDDENPFVNKKPKKQKTQSITPTEFFNHKIKSSSKIINKNDEITPNISVKLDKDSLTGGVSEKRNGTVKANTKSNKTKNSETKSQLKSRQKEDVDDGDYDMENNINDETISLSDENDSLTNTDHSESDFSDDAISNKKKRAKTLKAVAKKTKNIGGDQNAKKKPSKPVKTPIKSAVSTNKKRGDIKKEQSGPHEVNGKSNEIEIEENNQRTQSNSIESQDKKVVTDAKAFYHAFKQREGPKALGTREIPQGAENCLEGLTFVVTGILETMERDQCKETIEMYGGKLTQSISKKTDYVLVGREPGPAKMQKMKSLGVKELNEEAFYKLLTSLPAKESKCLIYKQPTPLKTSPQKTATVIKQEFPTESPKLTSKLTNKADLLMNGHQILTQKSPKSENLYNESFEKKPLKTHAKTESKRGPVYPPVTKLITKPHEPSLMWVDKYKPKTTADIIGQQGEKSSMRKLKIWLHDWFRNNRTVMGGDNAKKKATAIKKGTGGGFYKRGAIEDGSQFKAALLSGPPGIGKTTTALLTCKELGYTYTELNASNIRSKKCLKEHFADSVSTYNMANYIKGDSSLFRNHVLIMDEVDGMAGNEDRGGVQELIALIKSTKFPIICICNNRSDPKMRTLVNYCFDLRFIRPRPDQIKDAIMRMLYTEKVTVDPAVVVRMIQTCNNDIRQIIHHLSMFASDTKTLKYMHMQNELKDMKKDTKLDAFEITRSMFSHMERDALKAKSDMFFMDYSFIPLFVQETYLHVQPSRAGKDAKKHLKLLAKTAQYISDGDLMGQMMQKTNNWSILPMMGMASSVAPGELMEGYITSQIMFPQFLGKNSKRTKFARMIKEIKRHTSLRTHTDCDAINLDYMTSFKNAFSLPLLPNYNFSSNNVAKNDENYIDLEQLSQDTTSNNNNNWTTLGVNRVLQTLQYYYLLKEDYDNIVEMSKWSHALPLGTATSSNLGNNNPNTYYRRLVQQAKNSGGNNIMATGKKASVKYHIWDTFSTIDSKLKATLTRAYNKDTFQIPYIIESDYGFRKRGRGTINIDNDLDEDNGNVEIQENENPDDTEENKSGEEGGQDNAKDDPDFNIGGDKMIKKKAVKMKTVTAGAKSRAKKK